MRIRFSVVVIIAAAATAAGCWPGSAAEPNTETLLNPRALRGEPGPAATAAEMRRVAANPPAEYRSMPLWVWNDEMNETRMKEQLRQFREQGMGGVFIHPRPGLMTEYLGPEWFRLWRVAMEEGKRLGLLVNIYDENSYPSGFAGGHVPAVRPDTAAQYVQPEMDASRNALRAARSTMAAVFAVKKDAAGRVLAARRVTRPEQVAAGESLVAFPLRRAGGNPWTGEFPYVDLTNPSTTEAFLESTYEAYRKAVGDEFGKTVRWAFTDEPLLATGGAYDNARNALPLSYHTLAEFQRRNGYDLADHLASLFWDTGEFRKVRFDYWQTLHDLWKENFMRPMFEWTDRHNLQFTGHWMEHEWPNPWITPADANLYAFEHVPGIDFLEGNEIRLKGADPHLLFTVKQVASVAHQLGRRAFCEAYGVAGWDSTLEHYKRVGDWLMVHGINFMDQHLAFSTIRGARKRDHPQSFSEVAAWWPQYRIHGDHLGRVAAVSSRSEARNRLLVLQQTTSGFLRARRAGPTPELAEMRQNNAELNQYLADHQVDYDLGDEYMAEWFGDVRGKQVVIAKRAYGLVLWPPDMDNVRRQTIPLLERYLAAGGEIIALSDPARYVDGRESDSLSQMIASPRFAKQWVRVGSHAEMLRAVTERLKPRVRFDREVPGGVGFLERWLGDGSRVVFLTNSGNTRVQARARLEGSGVERLDGEAGLRVTRGATAGEVEVEVDLHPAGSMLLLLAKDAKTPAPGPPAPTRAERWTELTAVNWTGERKGANVLPLDYCDLTVGKERFADIHTWEANWIVWQRHGFERPAWDNAVQYRTRIFDRNRFAADTGFAATFHFEVAEAAALRGGLSLALETPELYRIAVNGRAVTFGAAAEPFLGDRHLRMVRLPDGFMRVGENTIEVRAAPFDVRMELENIYLVGDFATVAAAKGFRLAGAVATAGRKLELGSWKAQGLSFFGGEATYTARVQAPAGATRVQVALPEWAGSVARVAVDGSPAEARGWQPWQWTMPVAGPGEHTIAVTITATPRNTLGPFHHPAKPRMRAWPAAWSEFPKNQPPGADYDLLDYGLLRAPVVRVDTSEHGGPRAGGR